MIDKETAKERAVIAYNHVFSNSIINQIDNAIEQAVKEGKFSITLGIEFIKYEEDIKFRYKLLGYKVKYSGGLMYPEHLIISWE